MGCWFDPQLLICGHMRLICLCFFTQVATWVEKPVPTAATTAPQHQCRRRSPRQPRYNRLHPGEVWKQRGHRRHQRKVGIKAKVVICFQMEVAFSLGTPEKVGILANSGWLGGGWVLWIALLEDLFSKFFFFGMCFPNYPKQMLPTSAIYGSLPRSQTGLEVWCFFYSHFFRL